MDESRHHMLLHRLRGKFRPGRMVPGTTQGVVVEVRGNRDEAVLMLRWPKDPNLYGVPIDLADTGHEYYYATYPVADDDEWLESVGIGLMVGLEETRLYARRRRVGDYIELRSRATWPSDDRFCLDLGHPQCPDFAVTLRSDGLDPTIAINLDAQDRLLVWAVSYQDNSIGRPYVAQAVIATDGSDTDTAALEHLEAGTEVPDYAALSVAYFAAHEAAAKGVHTITTTLPEGFLDLAGFRPAPEGRRLETDFLHSDPDGARKMLEASLAVDSRWHLKRSRRLDHD